MSCSCSCACARPRRRGRHARRASPARRVLAGSLLVTLLSGTGVGWAYWGATGAGAATAQAATAVPLQVDATGGTPASLFPGRTASLSFLLSNPNAYPVSLTTLTAAAVTSSDEAACPGTWVTLPEAVTTALAAGGYALPSPVAVAAGASGTPVTLDGFLTMDPAAPEGCQGRTFSFALSFSGSQA